MGYVNIQGTITANPNGYDSVNSQYASVASNHPITDGYAASDSTTYSQISLRTGSGVSSQFFYTFDLSAIPVGATIDEVKCKAKAYISSTNASYIATREIQMCSGTTPKGSAGTLTNSATVFTLSPGTWTRAELQSAAVRLYAVRGTSSTSTSRTFRFYGAEIEVTYTYQAEQFVITAGSMAVGVSVAPASQNITTGGSATVTISGATPGAITVFDNGDDVTELLAESGANLILSLTNVDADHEIMVLDAELFLIDYRTQEDVDRFYYLRQVLKDGTATISERSEYVGNPIGGYCAADLNRVGAAFNEIAYLLTVAGYPVTTTLRDDWTDAEEFLAADLTAYLDAIAEMRASFVVYPTTPAAPADVANWQQANAIERILMDIFALQKNMMAEYFYLGEIYMGEVN